MMNIAIIGSGEMGSCLSFIFALSLLYPCFILRSGAGLSKDEARMKQGLHRICSAMAGFSLLGILIH